MSDVAEGTIINTADGSPIMFRDAAGVFRPVSAAYPLPATLASGSLVVGKVDIDQTTPGTTNGVTSVANGANGTSVFCAAGFSGGTALITNVAVDIKTSGANIYGLRTAKNTNAQDCYILFYNVVHGSVTVGTTVPQDFIAVPAGGYWDAVLTGEMKESLSTALSVAVVMNTITGSTAPTTPFPISILYK